MAKYKIGDILNKVIQGDVLTELKKFPDECIDMVMFSPPYWGLRNYQTEGQIGLERTFKEYLDKMIEVMREVKRVLKKTGTIWVNFGDSYSSHPAGNKYVGEKNIGVDGLFVRKMKQCEGEKSFVNVGGFQGEQFRKNLEKWKATMIGKKMDYPDKCLLLQPERFAIRCVDELGLILRNKIVWAKQVLKFNKDGSKYTIGSVMPTSVKTRFNEAYEFLYFFVKNNKIILWRNKKTKEWTDKKPPGINGVQGKDWEFQECFNKKTDCKKCQGTGFKKVSLWQGYSYWCDLDAVRIPPQTIETTYFSYRVRDAVRKAGQPQFKASPEEIEHYQKVYQGKFAGRQDAEMFGSPRARTQRNWRQEEAEGYKMGSVDPHRAALRGGLKSLAERMEDTKNKDTKSSRAYNIKKLLSEVRLGIKPNTGMIPNKFNDPRGNNRGGPGSWRDFKDENECFTHPLGKTIPNVWQINPEPHNFQKELGVKVDHFAIFPQNLCEIPIKFSVPKKICKNCGKIIE